VISALARVSAVGKDLATREERKCPSKYRCEP